jgi:hypothetical protein
MKRYETYIKELGGYPTIPPRIFSYFAYKNGECSKFDTSEEAKKYSNITESCCVNAEDVVKAKKSLEYFKHDVYNAWYSDLRKEYDNINDDTFSLCLDICNDRYDDFDYVAEYMETIVDFAIKVIKSSKG